MAARPETSRARCSFCDGRCETTATMLTAAAMATTTSVPTASAALARRLDRPTGGETAVIAMSFSEMACHRKGCGEGLGGFLASCEQSGAKDFSSNIAGANSRIDRQTALVIVVDAAQSYCPQYVHQMTNGATVIGPDR